ncbi:MAG: GIY-YIG nuclease family protein [Ferruginibacter sp.]
MPFFVYIIYSPTLDQFYIGHTENLKDRIFRHTNSESKSTKKANDWIVKYAEEYGTRAEAILRGKSGQSDQIFPFSIDQEKHWLSNHLLVSQNRIPVVKVTEFSTR